MTFTIGAFLEHLLFVDFVPDEYGISNSFLFFPFGECQLIAGSDNDSLKLYDIQKMPTTNMAIYNTGGFVTFDDFNQLTPVRVTIRMNFF